MWQWDRSRSAYQDQIRVRVDHGHVLYYSRLEREKLTLLKEIEELRADDSSHKIEINRKQKLILSIETLLLQLRSLHGIEPGELFTLPRHSMYVETPHQAEFVDRIFRERAAYEAEGKEVPPALIELYNSIKTAPPRKEYLEGIAEDLAILSNFDTDIIADYPEDHYLDQILHKNNYLSFHDISYNEIVSKAIEVVKEPSLVDLKNKTVIFTGAFTSFTAISNFVKCLDKIGQHEKIDAIITAGPWEKTIFLNKSSVIHKVKSEVKKLIQKFPIYALKSNQDSAVVTSELKKMGVKFVYKIEDKKNIFSNYKLSHVSSKDQLARFRDMGVAKNIFTYTSYVAFETHLNKDEIFYIVGSGSSSVNTPRSKPWVISFESQVFNSVKYDSTGGHLLKFDSKLNVHCSSFHYNRDLNGVFLNGHFFSPTQKTKRSDLHVIISDTHITHMNRYCFQGFLDFIEKEKEYIKTLVINGDFFDSCVLSHWDEKKIREQIKNKINIISFLHEATRARLALEDIKKRLHPNTRLIYKMGNHEINSLRKILDKSLLHFLDNLLDLKVLLGLDEMGFEIIDSRKSFKVAGIPFIHGQEKNRAKARKEHSRKNVLGHWHRCCIDNNGVCLPGMQDWEDADYMPYYKQNWKNGWAVLHELDGVGEKPQLMLFSAENSYYDFDTYIKVAEPYNSQLPKEVTLTIPLKNKIDF